MRIMCIGVVLVGALVANQVRSASFDCKKASTSTEKMVCADSSLSSLDEKLQKSYQETLGRLGPADKKDLVTEQRDWIKYVRDVCSDAGCLGKGYTARIALLAKTSRAVVDRAECSIPEGNSCRSVVYIRDTSRRMVSFNESLASNKPGAHVLGCDRLVDLPVGYANSNHSFGGYCTISNGSTRSRVMICNDEMIGHFAIQPVKENEGTDQDLVTFTNEHCFGG